MRCCSWRSFIRERSLASLVAEALDLGLEPLVEAHDEQELDAALATPARVIGINNRDLRTLDVDPERASRMRELIPEDRIAIAESGVRDASTLRGWRALGFDAALVGETLVRAGDPAATVRAFVAAGKLPDDPVEAARAPFVKICGIVDEAGVEAAVRAGADAIGLNLVPGTPRALELEEAVALAAHARRIAPQGRVPLIVPITVDRSADDLRAIGAALDADAIQLSGDEPVSLLAKLDRPAWKVSTSRRRRRPRPPARTVLHELARLRQPATGDRREGGDCACRRPSRGRRPAHPARHLRRPAPGRDGSAGRPAARWPRLRASSR